MEVIRTTFRNDAYWRSDMRHIRMQNGAYWNAIKKIVLFVGYCLVSVHSLICRRALTTQYVKRSARSLYRYGHASLLSTKIF